MLKTQKMATTRCLGKGQTFVTFMSLRSGSLYHKDLGWHLLKAAVIPKPAAPHREKGSSENCACSCGYLPLTSPFLLKIRRNTLVQNLKKRAFLVYPEKGTVPVQVSYTTTPPSGARLKEKCFLVIDPGETLCSGISAEA